MVVVCCVYGVVPKGLLTFLGSLYRQVAKTTSGTFVYRFERQTARKKLFLQNLFCPRFRNVGFYLRNLQIAAFCILMSYFMESKLKQISRQLVTCEYCDNWNSWNFGDPVLHHPKWIECDLLKPITLSLSSHSIQSVNNNPWRHWKDPQGSQVNKCPGIFQKCPSGTKLHKES